MFVTSLKHLISLPKELLNNNEYKQGEIIQMFDFCIDNIFVQFGGLLFHQTICNTVGTNCVPMPAGLFLHSYEAGSLQAISKNKERKLGQIIDSCFRYIDGVLSLNEQSSIS